MRKGIAWAPLAVLMLSFFGASAQAKLPPLSDEAKAKAAEAAAKTAHAGKVDNFLLCKSMDKVAARYAAEARKAGKTVKPTATAACVDPGKFVYTPAAPAPVVAAAAPAAPTAKK